MRSVDFFPLLAGFWTQPGTGPDPRRCSGKETRIRSPGPPPYMYCSDPDANVLARADIQVATIWRPCDVTNNIMVLISLLKEGKGRGQLDFAARKASSRRLRVFIIFAIFRIVIRKTKKLYFLNNISVSVADRKIA